MNVALYGAPGGKRWALTERRRGALRRDAQSLSIGPSGLRWDGECLTVTIDEMTAPLPTRLRGRVVLRPRALSTRRFTLDAAGQHRWQPISALARAEVQFDRPSLQWSGPAYLDTNDGDVPLEESFVEWDWCRAPLHGGAGILYNVARRDGSSAALALRTDPSGGIDLIEPLPPAMLPQTLWRLRRPTRADAGSRPRVLKTLEDTPFYARSVIATRLFGADVVAVHESLSLDRFRAPWVQAMLPFRIPRAWR